MMELAHMFFAAFIAALLLGFIHIFLNTAQGNKLSFSTKPQCGGEPLINYGVPSSSTEQQQSDTVRWFTCKNGYYLDGSNEITCQSNGHWLVDGYCKPISLRRQNEDDYDDDASSPCSLLPIISHGNLTFARDAQTAIFICDPGYDVEGTNVITCSRETRQWVIGGSCQLKKTSYKFMVAPKELERFLAAAESGNLQFIRAMLEMTSNEQLCAVETWRHPTIADYNTPLHAAIKTDQLQVVQHLLPEMNELLLTSNKQKLTPLHYAINLNATRVVEYLSSLKAMRQKILELREGNYGRTPLHLAALKGNADHVAWLLSNGANFTAKTWANDSENLPLHLACYFGHVPVVELLMKNDLDDTLIDDAVDIQGNRCVHKASLGGQLRVLEFLHKNGRLNTTLKNVQGRTALHLAAERGHLTIVKFLVQNGADLRAKSADKDGAKMAHHIAAQQGRLAVVKQLVDNYPDLLTVKDGSGKTALELAQLSKTNVNEVGAVVAFLNEAYAAKTTTTTQKTTSKATTTTMKPTTTAKVTSKATPSTTTPSPQQKVVNPRVKTSL